MINKEKTPETILTLVTALVIAGMALKLKVLFTIAAVLGLVGLFIKPLAQIIHIGWMKLSEALGAITSRILLTAIFYAFISPIAFLFKLFNKNAMLLKNETDSTFSDRRHRYAKDDFEKIW